jgi:hypothetical protein
MTVEFQENAEMSGVVGTRWNIREGAYVFIPTTNPHHGYESASIGDTKGDIAIPDFPLFSVHTGFVFVFASHVQFEKRLFLNVSYKQGKFKQAVIQRSINDRVSGEDFTAGYMIDTVGHIDPFVASAKSQEALMDVSEQSYVSFPPDARGGFQMLSREGDHMLTIVPKGVSFYFGEVPHQLVNVNFHAAAQDAWEANHILHGSTIGEDQATRLFSSMEWIYKSIYVSPKPGVANP